MRFRCATILRTGFPSSRSRCSSTPFDSARWFPFSRHNNFSAMPTSSTTPRGHHVRVTPLSSLNPHPPPTCSPPPHHVGSPPTSFQNPWPSAEGLANSLVDVFKVRFIRKGNFVPVPEGREELVKIRTCDWGMEENDKGTKISRKGLKATWIGHATWVVETTARNEGVIDVEETSAAQNNGIEEEEHRGVRVLFDPLFAERTSPFTFIGPKRYTPIPCTVAELPFIDAIVQSHNHYDHTDATAIKELFVLQGGRLHIFCALGSKKWYMTLLGQYGLKEDGVTELDWWDRVKMEVEGVGCVKLTCTPAQHNSARTPFDRNQTLWSSWVLEEEIEKAKLAPEGGSASSPSIGNTAPASRGANERARKLFFAGDTGYRAVTSPTPTVEEEASAAVCPAFREVGDAYGPFDLALLPIGLYSPRDFMSAVHCAPEDSVCIHQDIKSKKSIGMHYGTVRGGLSGQYEDVREPPRRWKECSERAGLVWGVDAALCDVGETVVVE